MGRLLAALIAESVPALAATPATPATPATLGPRNPERVAVSQESQRFASENPDEQTPRLLVALRAEGLPDDWLGLDHGDIAELAALNDADLHAYVRMLHEAELRERGRCPEDETARALCRSCGPVWLAPEVANVAPMIEGWPRVLGCPWCHVKNREAIPRPPASCGECRNFTRDAVNPPAGIGACTSGNGMHYPMASHRCPTFRPNTEPTA